jgi:hypothetical protein
MANIAYIDAANLDSALRHALHWKLDYKKFRIWLSDKYKVERAYIFIGYISKYKELYQHLQESGFTLVFKEVLFDRKIGKPKGNCDSDLLAQAFKDMYEGDLNKALIVASDGDYAPLVKALQSKNKLEAILSPSEPKKCSILLKRTGASIAYIADQRALLGVTP